MCSEVHTQPIQSIGHDAAWGLRLSASIVLWYTHQLAPPYHHNNQCLRVVDEHTNSRHVTWHVILLIFNKRNIFAYILMSSNLKCRTSLPKWWVWVGHSCKAHLTVLFAFMGEPWSRSNTGGWLWHQAARWGSCALSLIQVESFDKFQRPGGLRSQFFWVMITSSLFELLLHILNHV